MAAWQYSHVTCCVLLTGGYNKRRSHATLEHKLQLHPSVQLEPRIIMITSAKSFKRHTWQGMRARAYAHTNTQRMRIHCVSAPHRDENKSYAQRIETTNWCKQTMKEAAVISNQPAGVTLLGGCGFQQEVTNCKGFVSTIPAQHQ